MLPMTKRLSMKRLYINFFLESFIFNLSYPFLPAAYYVYYYQVNGENSVGQKISDENHNPNIHFSRVCILLFHFFFFVHKEKLKTNFLC